MGASQGKGSKRPITAVLARPEDPDLKHLEYLGGLPKEMMVHIASYSLRIERKEVIFKCMQGPKAEGVRDQFTCVFPLVRRSWNRLLKQDEELSAQRKCLTEVQYATKPEALLWSEFYKLIASNRFDKDTDPTGALDFLRGGAKVSKTNDKHDTTVALISRIISEGEAYCEFLLSFSDEIFFGVTNDGVEVSTTGGWTLLGERVGFPKVWGYWSKRGVRFSDAPIRHQVGVPHFSRGDRVGVRIDATSGAVQFYKNSSMVAETTEEDEYLKPATEGGEKRYQFFMMLDRTGDTVEIVNCF